MSINEYNDGVAVPLFTFYGIKKNSALSFLVTSFNTATPSTFLLSSEKNRSLIFLLTMINIKFGLYS